ncbi:Putative sterigmatocystin biosynthesis P450 monooxygenase [Tolypocladium paradoxum]|uniref:Sterigmatocystin biosynthesis P450 monooxygenase n=1 Tax=Tolypocladium paradoxum TaxID=94208 RepID=A0A2S4KRT7_9HYPO|nr:Putative sterigmatocystin biosynthesis P450 monooxygenase [Tolypocladium paradoxum]
MSSLHQEHHTALEPTTSVVLWPSTASTAVAALALKFHRPGIPVDLASTNYCHPGRKNCSMGTNTEYLQRLIPPELGSAPNPVSHQAMAAMLGFKTTLLLVFSAAVAFFGHCLFKLLRARSFFRGLPQPPNHSLRHGHIPVFLEVAGKFPPSTHPQHFYTYMSQKYSLPGIFYVDCWPYADHQMVITDPDAAMQILTKTPYPKHKQIEKFLRPFTGPDSIAASNGERWKMNHRMVGSGFTPTYIKPMMGMIVEHVLVFHDTLRKLAESRESFSMEEETAKVVFDVIGKIVFGFSLEAQRNGSPLLHDLRSSIDPATATLGGGSWWKPWANRDAKKQLADLKQRVHDTLAREMNGRLQDLRDEKDTTKARRAKSIMDRIVLDKLQSEPNTTKLEEAFVETAVTK